MMIIYVLLAILLFLIIFLFAPAVVCYRSVFGRCKVLPLDDEKLNKPAIESYKERMLSDLDYLRDAGFERISVTASDGVTLCGDHYDHGSDHTVLMIHGYNADPYVNLVSPARWFYNEGFNVLVIYQRAHAYSGGKRCGMGLIEKDDVEVWVREILNKDPSQRVLLYGTSMGGSTLAYLSDTLTEDHVPCMMIDCGYISTQNQLRDDAKRMHLPPLLIPFMRLLARWDQKIDLRERTTDHLQNAKKPILFFHGTADLTVSLEEGRKNYEACASDKAFVEVEGAGHTTAFCTNEQQVTAAMREFLNTYFYQ